MINDMQRAACKRANANGLPFAIWRDPFGADFTALISTSAPQLAPVFGGPAAPGFVMAPFSCEDGNLAWTFAADVLVSAGGARYRDGNALGPRPQTDEQAMLTDPQGPAIDRLEVPQGENPAPTERESYMARVARAVEKIGEGGCDKIVLSRIDPRDLPAGRDLLDLTEHLAQLHPHAFVCLVSSQETGTWLTATPEVLLARDAEGLRTMALAGTQWPDPETDIDSLTWPQKIIDEQAHVADFIRDAFAAEGFSDVEETAPYTVRAANLCHLRSDFRAPSGDGAALGRLLGQLHPTSAVCGMPKAPAMEFILQEEGATRRFYTGYLGPRDLGGATSLYVNLRSASVSGGKIFLHVGGGIVAASDPATEWEETVEKSKTIGAIL
ncbi:Salicylate biosynthesis isochorismate synthase [Pseudooceanicola algae]|uniref:Salicylate biosynthesis isochorismate synthase n=1 Tax=Pseudooceanicola algae TaxID=1537215 RepID=A0A418SL14_9RHOB|nr:Salicylate biosynthesis isochorismate synthase [Pseudooceanicola algae]